MGSTIHTYHFHLWKLLRWFLVVGDYQALFWRRCRGAIAWGWYSRVCLFAFFTKYILFFLFCFCLIVGETYKKFKKNENTKKVFTCLSCLKRFSKREVIGKLSIEEVRVDLEHLCSCSRKQCRIFHGSLCVKSYPLVYIHCIIKIMCQALVLVW